jgi:urease accessory protein
MRKGRPFVLSNMKTGDGVDAILAFLRLKGGLKAA